LSKNGPAWPKKRLKAVASQAKCLAKMATRALPERCRLASHWFRGLPDVEYKKLKTIEDEAYRSADELNILFSYELPRCGTILKVKLVANKYSLSFYRTFKREPSEVEILNHYESLIKTESINFKWDKTHSRFVLQYL
jgi:hypothetical protein